jgi:hypothetical protein
MALISVKLKEDDLITIKRLVNQYHTDESLEFDEKVKDKLFTESMDLLVRLSKQYTFVCTPKKE